MTDDELRRRLIRSFVWQGDRTDDTAYADMTGWWADPEVLAALGPALAGLFPGEAPTLVLGIESRGSLLGPLVAVAAHAGFLEVRKNRGPSADSDAWRHVTTPPDYRDRHLRLGVRARHVSAGHRVLAVDDWIQTGGQMLAARRLVEQAGAAWLGLAVVVEGLEHRQPRHTLGVRSLLHARDL